MSDDAFIRHKSRHAITWALLHLQRLHEAPCATSMGTPLAGRTAFLVGAGYSLTRNGEHLRDAQAKGGVIIGTNSSDPVLRELGVVPDAVVARESIDNSAEIAASEAPLVCLDIGVHPAMWRAAEGRLAWFIPGYPRHFHITQRLGIRPTFGGSSAFTTAVHLARVWGAERIVLVGSGLALTRVGDEWASYHPSAPRGDCVFDLRGDALHMRGNVANDAVTIASGQQPQPKVIGYERVPSLDWSEELPIIDVLLDQRQWLETEARRHGDRVDLVNANEGGCGIVGWRVRTLADVVRDMPETPGAVVFRGERSITEEHVRALVRDLLAECDLLERASALMLERRGPPLAALPHVSGLAFGAPLIETLAAWRILDAPTSDAGERCRYVYQAMREAADEARRVLRAGRREAA